MVRPDGTVLPPFDAGKSINGPWGIAIDGNDNVWVANATGHSVAHSGSRCFGSHSTTSGKKMEKAMAAKNTT